MSNKKGKALAMKLIDDLLNEDDADPSSDQKPNKARSVNPPDSEPTRVRAVGPAQKIAEVEISDIVEIPTGPNDTDKLKPEPVSPLRAAREEILAEAAAQKSDDTVKLTASRVAQAPEMKITEKL